MSGQAHTFRVFVSSTFSDLKAERDALQARVFPRLRELCLQQGARFQAIDLRWGVSQQASLDQQTMNICLGEIERCRRVSPRPNFVVLLGDRYGWMPPPPQIPAGEFEAILGLVGAGDRSLLETWYRRDDNAVPPEYLLLPREPGGEFEAYETWAPIETRLHQVLACAASRLDLEPGQRLKYTASATHQEIAAGALSVDDAPEHVFGFFRRIVAPDDIPNRQAGEFFDLDPHGTREQQAAIGLAELKGELRAGLAKNVYEYDARWTDEGPTASHIDHLCDDVYRSLAGVIREELAQLETLLPLEVEVEAHRAFGEERCRFFTGRAFTLEVIRRHLEGKKPHPLAIWGESGSGKSALLAQATKEARESHPGANVITRFIGATPESASGSALLESLCHQISRRYGVDDPDIPVEFKELVREFQELLALATPEKPLILFVDALDQLSAADRARSLSWLPGELPEHVHLVVSTLPGECKTALEAKLPPEHLVELEPMPENEAGELLALWLQNAGRTLRPEQHGHLLARFSLCPRPLYLKLAFEEARRWRSYDGLPGLSDSIEGLIGELFARLSSEAHHGEMLVSRSLGYLAAAKNGLTEDELLDLLARDVEVYTWFLQTLFHTPPDLLRRARGHLERERVEGVSEGATEAWLNRLRGKEDEDHLRAFLTSLLAEGDGLRLPVVLWARLYAELEPYLTERAADGTSLLSFYHGQMGYVAATEYLPSETKARRHRALAGYFGAQPLEMGGDEGQRPNLRMLSELPYQQAYAEMWDDLLDSLTSLDFLYAKAGAFGPRPLIEDYDHAYSAGYDGRQLHLVRDALALSQYPLSEDQNLLPGQLVGRLMHQQEPGLRRLYEQALAWRRAPWLRPCTPSLTPPGSPLVGTFTGHTKRVTDVAASGDGRHMLTASDDGTIKLWHVQDEVELRTFRGHRDAVTSVAWIPDHKRFVSASRDKTVKVWDLGSGEEFATLEGHDGDVMDVVVSPDGRQAISCSLRGEIIFWNLETGELVDRLIGHQGRIYALSTTPDRRFLVSAAEDKTIKVWELYRRRQVRVLGGHEDSVWAVSVTPDGKYVVSASWDKTIKVWRLETGEMIRTLRGHTAGVDAVSVTQDGKRIISAAPDRTIKVWSFDSGELLRSFSTPFPPNGLTLTPDAKYALAAARDAEKWDLAGNPAIRIAPEGHKEYITSIAVHPECTRALTASNDTTIKEWDLESGNVVRTLRGHSAPVTAVSISKDGERLLSGSFDQTVKYWNYRTGEVLRTFEGHDPVDAVALSRNGDLAASGSRDGTVRIWNLRSAGEGIPLSGPPADWIMAIAISPDGTTIASGEWNGALKLWDVKNRTMIHQCTGHEDRVTSLRFSWDGDEVISASADGSIRLWSMPFLEPMLAIEGHKNIVESAVLTPDRHFAISCSDDKMLKVWDLERECLFAAFCGFGPLVDCDFTMDGKRLVVAETAGWIHVLGMGQI